MTTADASAIYQREKAAYIARNGTDGVALMPRRKERKRKRLKAPQGINNLKVYVPDRRSAAAKDRAARRKKWDEMKRVQGKTPDPPVRPRYRGGDRKPTHCYRGHEYTTETTSIIVNKNSGRKQRVCLVCRRQWGAEWLARKRASA